MKIILFVVFVLFCLNPHAETLKVAVLDTGFNMENKSKDLKLCKSGHRDFTGTGLQDSNGHGTNVVGLISKGLSSVDYCIVVIKIYSDKGSLDASINALTYVNSLDVKIVNMSYGGIGFSHAESVEIKKLLDKDVDLVVASGNFAMNFDISCNFYPACYDKRLTVVGNKNYKSNYGKIVDLIIDGNNKEALGISLSGSSQSTAIHTNKLIVKYGK